MPWATLERRPIYILCKGQLGYNVVWAFCQISWFQSIEKSDAEIGRV